MGLILNGGSPSKMIYNGAEVSLYFNGSKIWPDGSPTPPTPPGPSIDEVTIGTQTWMSKNLAIDDGDTGIYTQTVNYGQGDVVEYYYTWYAAKRIVNSINGWHLPTQEEWNTLAAAGGEASTAGTKLKSTYGWTSSNGTDDFGFSVFPAGRYNYTNGNYAELYTRAYYWTDTDSSLSTNAAIIRYFMNASINNGMANKNVGYSVRLIKDS